MDERYIIKNAVDELTKNGGAAWWRRGKDIFGIFDIVFLTPSGETSFFQVSTKDHRWSRMQKIDAFQQRYGLPERSYLMLWDYSAGEFIIEPLC